MRPGLVVLLATLVGCTFTDAPSAEAVERCARDGGIPPGPVRVDGTSFVAGGEPFVPRGIGSYPLLQHAGNGRLAEVRDIYEQARALDRPLVRTNAFFEGGDNPARIREDDGTIREAGLAALDRVIAEAEAQGIRLLLTLGSNWPSYGGAQAVVEMAAPGEGLPKDAFWSEPRVVAAQRSYVQTLIARENTVTGRPYAGDPTIFAWELANEPRCTDPAWCEPDTLVRWARTMATALREAGARQPIAWGGSGHLGKHGEDLRALAADGAVDVLTLHVYPFSAHALALADAPPSTRPALGSELGSRAIRSRARIAREHDMPLLVEELGWKAGDGERALVLGAWLRTAREQGVGALPWMIGERGRPDYDGLLIRPSEDPATVEALRCE